MQPAFYTIRFAALFLAFSSLVFSQQPVKSIKDVLSPESFKRSGLEKLTTEELEFLSIQLFGQHLLPIRQGISSPHTSQGIVLVQQEAFNSLPSGESAFGHEEILAAKVIKIQKVPNEIQSRIVGPFRGWTGRTLFVLENGQEWKQSESGEFDVNMDTPEVTIRKGLLGVFYLHVKGYGTSIKVRRIK